jgi:hypothetical protein
MSRFAWPHHWRARATPANISSLVHRQSSVTHHLTLLFKQKDKCACLRRKLKIGRHKSYPTMASGYCCRSSSASPPAPRWCHGPWYSSHWTRTTWRVLITFGWAAKRSAPRAHQRGGTLGCCTTGCATPLHTSCSRTLTQRQQQPSSQRTRIHGMSVATYVVGWASGGWWAGRCDGTIVGCGAQNNPRVTVGDDHEVPCLTMDSAVQPLWTASKRRLRRSLPYTAAHAAT